LIYLFLILRANGKKNWVRVFKNNIGVKNWINSC